MSDPLISVITAVYNGAAYLPDLIESVLAQDYPHYEHIIIDDGSTDDGATVAILEQYPHLKWWSHANKGQYATQNDGIEAATGDLVVVIAADDIFTPQTFSRVIEYYNVHPQADLIYGKTGRMDATGKRLPQIDISAPPSLWLLKHIVYAQHCSVFVRRELMPQHPFDATYRYVGDWDWLIRVFRDAEHIGYIRQTFAVVRMHGEQTSRLADKTQQAQEHRRIRERYGGSYWISNLLRKLNNYRAMTILGMDVIRKQGLRTFAGRIREWVQRRLFRR